MAIPNNNYTVMEDGSIAYSSDPVNQSVSNTTSNMVRDYQGKEYDPAVILALSKQIAAAVDPKAIKGGVFTTKGESVGFNYDEATRLLGRAPNSAEQVFLDMARHLAKEGVTDLKNADLTETNRRFGSTFTGGGGTIYEIKKDASGNPVISTWSKDTSDKGAILGALAIAGLAFGVPALFGETLAGTAGLTASELATADMALGGLGGTAGATALAESAALGATGAGALATQNAFELANAGASALTDTTAGLLTGGAETAATTLGTQTGGGLLTGGAGTVGTTGLTAAELALQDISLGGLGGTAGAETLASALTTGATVPTITSLTGGSGLLTGAAGGITADTVANKLAADAFETLNAGASAITPTEVVKPTITPAVTASPTVISPVEQVIPPPSVTPSVVPSVVPSVTPSVTPSLNTISTLTSLLPGASTLLNTLTTPQISNLLSGGLGTAGNLLQMQQSREAALAAQAKIDAETEAAKQAAQFRPVGTTTRFGTSEFTYDPVTGRMVSSGYQLTPEAKAQQDRLMALSNAGLTQAEQAQAQFAPLQTGAQSLFGLGNQYLAQSPEDVANRYISQQMNLLAPSRELDLANLQNKLFQQGRSGLAVAQGGNLGATTPELQALYNARAQQDAQLAAQAQLAGQQQVSFGAGLLGQGAGAMGQYYAGQQAAYAPYTTAMGQVQNLEAQAQQPYNMSLALAQQQAAAGTNVGRMGLTGAQLSTNLATSADATRNLGAQALIAAGNPNAQFGQALGQWATGLFSPTSTGVAGNPYAVGEYANPGYWT